MKRGVGLGLLLVFLLAGCEMQSRSNQPYPFQYSNGTMGTSFTIKVSQLPEAVGDASLKQQIDALLALINGQMSTYLPDSELSRFNNSQSTEWRGFRLHCSRSWQKPSRCMNNRMAHLT
nr:FAD:protein FMN transferase [Methylomarinum sp. Ch1-1]MDP4520955.1 FAD:protein FMN transferase [Methylomarinum sp. Ch1-1]